MSRVKVENIRHRQSSDDAISLAADSSVSLKHSGNQKLVTSSTGVTITGACAATSYTGDASSLTGIVPATGGTFTGGITVDAINDTVFAITDASSVALDPDNGMVQTWTLGANRTATDSLTTGQSMLLVITASSSNYTLTWPTMTWSGGSAPTLGGATPTAIVLWKISSTLYGATVGDLG